MLEPTKTPVLLFAVIIVHSLHDASSQTCTERLSSGGWCSCVCFAVLLFSMKACSWLNHNIFAHCAHQVIAQHQQQIAILRPGNALTSSST